jgi:hypothetical protein
MRKDESTDLQQDSFDLAEAAEVKTDLAAPQYHWR